MGLHADPKYNTPEIVRGLKAHSMEVSNPSMMSDAFRLGFVFASNPPCPPQYDWVSFQESEPLHGDLIEVVCVIDDEDNCPYAAERNSGPLRQTFNAFESPMDTHWRHVGEDDDRI